MEMQCEDYPSLLRGSDAAAASAQRTHSRLQGVHLGSLIASAGFGAFAPVAAGAAVVWIYTVVAIILLVDLVVLMAGSVRQYDKAWFECRAIAGSVKTLTWRFMMGAHPFRDSLPAEVDKAFIAQMKKIRKARPDCCKHLADVTADGTAITDVMQQVRQQTFDERKSFYIQERLRNQKSWYSKSAKQHKRRGEQWFWLTCCLQFLALAVAIVQAISGGFGYALVPVLTTCAAAAAAWSRMRRHDELAQTYSVVAQELAEIEALVSGSVGENDFLQLLEQVEGAISHEHTMWSARREITQP